jgi:hypothetical protein|uniref:Uncharacterized protein n=1 Tax=Sipha flava TaxID=143950 RepID=A0A2S2RAC7_9HEMI
MFFWFNRDDHNTKLPKVRTKSNDKQLSNNQKHLSENSKNISKYTPLPAINTKNPYKKLERQTTYIVTTPVFVKPIKRPKQRKKPMTFKDFKKNLKKINKNDEDDNGMIWIDL